MSDITGTAGDDVLDGTADDDTIRGLGGDDRLRGHDGDDEVHGGDGDDTVTGNDGADTLYGDAGFDKINGNAGDDVGYGGDKADRMYGHAGDDTLYGDGGNDTIYGGLDDDIVIGGRGIDRLYGDEGNDILKGGGENDKLFGGDGTDMLYGGSGNDGLNGKAGNDTLLGGNGDDSLNGNIGNDKLYGEDGVDRLYGHEGNDRLHGGADNDVLFGGDGADILTGGTGWDFVDGGNGADTLLGGAGNDTVKGRDGADTLFGGLGNDTVNGGDDADILVGGLGNDKLIGGRHADTFVLNALGGADRIEDFAPGVDVVDLTQLGLRGGGQSDADVFADLIFTRTGAGGRDTVVTFAPSATTTGVSVKLVGVKPADLSVSDFIYSGGETNVAPRFESPPTFEVKENATSAFTAIASDPEGRAITYSLTGTDASLFTINTTTGAVSFKTPPNYESPDDSGADNVYNVTVRASDGTATSTQAVAVTVTDVSEGNPEEIAIYLEAGAKGFKWDVAPGGTLEVDVTGLTADGKMLARAALEVWSDATGILFSEVSSGADITFDDEEAGAYASWSASGSFFTSADVNISTAWIATYEARIDGYAYQTYIHEIGHALGLGHPGPYDGSADYATDAIYVEDSWQTTVMSYFSQTENTYLDSSFAYIMTPQMADVMAIWSMYGTPTTTRTGDTVYGYNSTAGNDIFDATAFSRPTAYTIVDSSGDDTLDYSGASHDQTLDLRAGYFSSVDGLDNNVAISVGTVIENAIGGTGADVLYGNAADNTLTGGSGADRFISSEGSDVFAGDSGSDTAVFSGLAGDYTSSTNGSGNTVITHNTTGAATELISIETIIYGATSAPVLAALKAPAQPAFIPRFDSDGLEAFVAYYLDGVDLLDEIYQPPALFTDQFAAEFLRTSLAFEETSFRDPRPEMSKIDDDTPTSSVMRELDPAKMPGGDQLVMDVPDGFGKSVESSGDAPAFAGFSTLDPLAVVLENGFLSLVETDEISDEMQAIQRQSGFTPLDATARDHDAALVSPDHLPDFVHLRDFSPDGFLRLSEDSGPVRPALAPVQRELNVDKMAQLDQAAPAALPPVGHDADETEQPAFMELVDAWI
jgi:Ca2+-binding RTX toxin-like protein